MQNQIKPATSNMINYQVREQIKPQVRGKTYQKVRCPVFDWVRAIDSQIRAHIDQL